jgi:hypothetical protein
LLEQHQKLPRDELSKLEKRYAGVSLKQANGSLVYFNVRLLRCSEPWICKGATHEAWTCPPERITAHFDAPVLADRNDGGCKSDKYPRDVRLLLEDLAEMPNDARTLFYLGQTYLCMRNYAEGIPVLKKRIEVGGWDEETYIAYMYLGECLMGAGRKDEAVRTWLDGWQYRQHRTEIPMKLITYYRNLDKSQFIATMFLEKLFAQQFGEDLRTGQPTGVAPVNNRDMLFVNKRDVDYHIYEELMILAYYSSLHKSAFLRLDDLDMKTNLHWHDFNSLFGQLHWYHWMLKGEKTRLKPKISLLPWVDEDDAHIWQPFNPSIRQKLDGSGYKAFQEQPSESEAANESAERASSVKNATGYELNLRFANYWTNEAKHYQFRAFDGQVLTRNLFTEIAVNGDFNKPSVVEEIKIDPAFKQDMGSHIKGMEDCRMIMNSCKREFLGTSKSYADNGINKIFHCIQDEPNQPWKIRQLPLPSGISPGDCQKNWMGFRTDEGELRYIFSFTPFRICDENGADVVNVNTFDIKGFQSVRDEATGRVTRIENSSGFKMKEWRGSAGPVPWRSEAYPEERYLCVLHKVQIGGDGRWYYHRFMTLDKDLKPSRVSCFVRMTKERVEYWSGMCGSLEKEGSYKITYGLKDSEAWIADIDGSYIDSLMFYDLQKGTTLGFPERLVRINQ